MPGARAAEPEARRVAATGTEARVREAAVRLFARRGFAATGLRELAAEAGLTPAGLYHYMGTKEDLLVEIMRSTTGPLLDAGRALPRARPPEWRLAALVESHVWLHGSRPLACLVSDTELRALQGARRAAVVAQRDAYEAIWRALVSEGARAGRFDVPDAQVAANGLLKMATNVAHWYRPSGRLKLPELCAMHADLALGMVRARAGNRPVRRAGLDLPPPAVSARDARGPRRAPSRARSASG